MSNKNEIINNDSKISSSVRSLFIQKEYIFESYLKSKNIFAATLLILKTSDTNDKLKDRIKDLSFLIMSSILKLKDINSKYEWDKNILNIENMIVESISIFEGLSVSGDISMMNTAIIVNEMNTLMSCLLAINYFNIENKDVSLINIFKNTSESTQLEVVNQNTSSIKNKINSNNSQHSIFEDNGDKRHNRKDNRKGLIYNFVLNHKDVNIKDIVPNIKGCSEKTVQRELIELINEGKIVKKGERRWSRYSVI